MSNRRFKAKAPTATRTGSVAIKVETGKKAKDGEETKVAEEYIRLDQYPGRRPRLGMWLAQRVFARFQESVSSGHPDPMGEDDIESTLANLITRTDTTRVVMDSLLLQTLLMEGDDPNPQGIARDRQPPDGDLYIEADEPGMTMDELARRILSGEDQEDSPGTGLIHPHLIEAAQPIVNPLTGKAVDGSNKFEGVLISGKGSERSFFACYSADSGLSMPGYDVNLETGVGRNMQDPSVEIRAHACMNILKFISDPDVELLPEPLDADGYSILKEHGIRNPWYVVTERLPEEHHQ